MRARRTARTYFFLQATAIAGWWALLLVSPHARAWFRMGPNDDALLAFALPDLLAVVASGAAAWLLCMENEDLAAIAAWSATAFITGSTLYCVGYALITDTGWLGVVLMSPAVAASGCSALAVTPPLRNSMFRPSAPGSPAWCFAKTLVQTAVIWTLILFAIPILIAAVEQNIGVPVFELPLQAAVGWLMFAACSALGIWSARTMSQEGQGTPLPMDTARELVVKGAYRYVRNPMAIAGIGQGIAVGVIRGSWLVILYALLGAILWQLIFRPLEEEDLLRRFGGPYERYCERVRCWVPGRG